MREAASISQALLPLTRGWPLPAGWKSPKAPDVGAPARSWGFPHSPQMGLSWPPPFLALS